MDTVLFGDGGCAVRSAGQHTNERVAIDVASIFADWRATFTFHVLQPSAPRLSPPFWCVAAPRRRRSFPTSVVYKILEKEIRQENSRRLRDGRKARLPRRARPDEQDRGVPLLHFPLDSQSIRPRSSLKMLISHF